MFPVLFDIGPITVYSYGFFLVLAYFVAAFILWREGKRQGYNEEKLLDLSVISLIAALVGGRLYYAFLNPDLFTDEPIRLLAFWDGGFAYFGSLLLVFVVAIYFIQRWKWSFFQIADISALSASSALVLGRVGAYFAGVDFGKLSDLPWAIEFPNIVGSRHPVQLYEAAAYFFIFVVLYLFYFKVLSSRHMVSGKIFFAFLILTSIARAGLEFLRADSHTIFSVPTAAIISLFIAISSIAALYYFGLRDGRQDLRNILMFVFGINGKILRRLKI